MDWSAENSGGTSSGQLRDGTLPEEKSKSVQHKQEHFGVDCVCHVEDNDMEGDGSEDVLIVATQSEKQTTSLRKKQRSSTLLNFVKIMPKPKGGCINISSRAKSQSRKDKQTMSVIKRVSKNTMDSRNLSCPIPGCPNWGSRGFRRNGISKYLMGLHSIDLLKTSPNYM